MSNIYSINEEIARSFEQFAEPYDDVQPPFAEKSFLSLAEIAVWPNRVPEHEPWPRVMKQGKDDPPNEKNDGYKHNTDWIDQFDNVEVEKGIRPIGRVEGDEDIPRGILWRR